MTEEVSLGAQLAVQGYRAGSWLSQRVPYDVGRAVSSRIGDVLYRLTPSVRARLERTFGRVLGQSPGSPLLDAAVREAFRSYCLYWFETFHLQAMPLEEVVRRGRLIGREHMDAAVAAGNGAIIALPHLGNWDAAGRMVVGLDFRITAVAEELKPPEAFRLFLEHRKRLGMGIVALSAGRKVGEELVRLLSENELICLVADRDLTGRGVDVEMFGARTQLPAGPALLALGTGAPLIVAAAYHVDGGGWEVVMSPPVEIERTADLRADVATLTRKIAAAFERQISSAPTTWHMFQPYWPADLPSGAR
jgi:lauroyl/myristoyl acyltransferase